MKSLSIILSTLLLGAVAYGAGLSSKSTDDLLNMRGTMTTDQDRNQLHNELTIREKTMTQEQLQKFKTYPPENRVRKYKGQEQGQGQGQGQGMGQGQGQGQGMGGGKNR